MPARKDDKVWHDVHELYDVVLRAESAGWEIEFRSRPAAYPVLVVVVRRGDFYAESRVYAHVQWMTVAEYWRSAYRVALFLIRNSGLTPGLFVG